MTSFVTEKLSKCQFDNIDYQSPSIYCFLSVILTVKKTDFIKMRPLRRITYVCTFESLLMD